MDRDQLLEVIEALRVRLSELANESGSLLDPNVIALSQELDEFIVEYLSHKKIEISAR